MASENAEAAAAALERTVNQFGGKEDADHIVNHLLGMHRTLNQEFVNSIVIPFVRAMAKNYSSHDYDARNRAACLACRFMYDALKDQCGLDSDNADFSLAMV